MAEPDLTSGPPTPSPSPPHRVLLLKDPPALKAALRPSVVIRKHLFSGPGPRAACPEWAVGLQHVMTAAPSRVGL